MSEHICITRAIVCGKYGGWIKELRKKRDEVGTYRCRYRSDTSHGFLFSLFLIYFFHIFKKCILFYFIFIMTLAPHRVRMSVSLARLSRGMFPRLLLAPLLRPASSSERTPAATNLSFRHRAPRPSPSAPPISFSSSRRTGPADNR